MKRFGFVLISLVLIFSACGEKSSISDEPSAVQDEQLLSPVPEGAQALSLFGEPLYAASPVNEETLKKYEAAKNEYEAQPDDVEKLIWFGRWTAYKGDYRESIRIYSEGLKKFPNDARLYRHRGHRYISIREFDRAIQDFEMAANLIAGTKDQVEPDGQPNEMNIPISSLHTNIWYHLGLAYYLKHDLENALRVYCQRIDSSWNDDNVVSTIHWLYMTLRLLGREDEATKVLDLIHEDMEENK